MTNRVTGYVMAAILMMIWGGIGELATMSDADMVKLNALMEMPVVKDATFWGFVTTWVDFGANWSATLWDLFWMRASFFTSEWNIFFIIMWLPVAVGIILGMVALLRGTSA